MKNFNLAKKMLALALGVLMLLSVMTGCSKTNDQAGGGSGDTQQEQTGALLKKIKDSGKLVVGTEAQYAPYEFKDLDANFVGCDMWLAQQIADSLGVQLEVVDMSFDGIIPAVQSGQVDLGIAAFTNTPERAKEIDFSNLYETSAQLLIVSGCQCGICPSQTGKLCAQQTANLLSEKPKGFFDSLTGFAVSAAKPGYALRRVAHEIHRVYRDHRTAHRPVPQLL